MPAVTATEFTRNFGRYREMAQREPVAVTSHDRVTGYFVSAVEFEEFRRAKSLTRAGAATSEPSFASVWNNPEDDIYDAL